MFISKQKDLFLEVVLMYFHLSRTITLLLPIVTFMIDVPFKMLMYKDELLTDL